MTDDNIMLTRRAALVGSLALTGVLAWRKSMPARNAKLSPPVVPSSKELDGSSKANGPERKVTIRRDLWGVPHLFADTLADGAYGLGYAQAEDRLEQIYSNYRQAAGRMAEVGGESHIEDDWKQRLSGHEEVCSRRYPELPLNVRFYCDSFQDGVNAYITKHTSKLPSAIDIEPWMIPAVLRMLIFNWPIGEGMRKLGLRNEVHLFSNEWAVRPERTADGAAILLTDPHVPLDGPFRFYEFRMHAGGTDISGFGPVGTPFIGVGHNANLGWALTTGGPETTDIYVEEVDAANPSSYRYDNDWRPFSREKVSIAVKDAPTVIRTMECSHHGPIISREDNKAYAIACPYLGEIDLVTQFYRMMTARKLSEFDDALAMCQLMQQNVMYADVEGNIQYVRTGRVPIRPPGFDFSKPVPGNTSKSEWRGIHPMKDLVQVHNPSTGYLQNCNIGPDTMARGLKLNTASYPAYIYNDQPGQTNSRGRRAITLLEAHPKLTIEEAKAIVIDIYVDGCTIWQAALSDAVKKLDLTKKKGGAESADLRKSIANLITWDGMMDQNSTGATLYNCWRISAEQHGIKDLNGPHEALFDALAEAVAWLKLNYGSCQVAYGELHRVRHGDRSWPLSGNEETLKAIVSKVEGKVAVGTHGQNWTQLVQFKKGAVRSWSATAYGESDDPASKHYTDQAEKLYSQRKLKPTWFIPSELAENIESTTVLMRR